MGRPADKRSDMGRQRVNQQAIADELNISRSTVTKVLNHDPNYPVPASTRARILETAASLGYQPRRRRTGNIAFVVCKEMYTSEYEINREIANEASRDQQRVLLVNMDAMPTYRELSLYVNPLTVDGAILIGDYGAEVVERLNKVVPIILIDDRSTDANVDCIHTDNAKLSRMLTEKIIEYGHSRISLLIHSIDSEVSRKQIDGYAEAHSMAGLDIDQSLIVEKCGRRYAKLVKSLLDIKPGFTALLACTVTDHPVILTAFNTLGIDIPQSISYVGWAAGRSSALDAFPDITSIEGFHYSIARTAVRRLNVRIESRDIPVEKIEVPMSIHTGETCRRLSLSAGLVISK